MITHPVVVRVADRGDGLAPQAISARHGRGLGPEIEATSQSGPAPGPGAGHQDQLPDTGTGPGHSVTAINARPRRHNPESASRSRDRAALRNRQRGPTVYREHFKLKDRPFAHAPGERTFQANATMSDALGRLQQLFTARDAVAVVTGGPGVGKSTLVEYALAALGSRVQAARVDLRYGDPADLCAATLLALGTTPSSMAPAQVHHELRLAMGRLAAEDKRLVLCLDISGISADIARHLLRIANLAGERGCQLNIVLMGPHPLHQQVDVPALIQLRQRIAFRHRVRPLTLAETDRYIRHQVEAVGADATALLSSNVGAAVYCYVAGVPRLINTLLDAALSDACLQGVQRPDGNFVKRTAEGLGWKPMTPPQSASDAAARPASAAPRPAAVRSSPPKIAAFASAERPRSTAAADAAGKPELPEPSELTLALRAGAAAEAASVSLAAENRSPTAAIFGGSDGGSRNEVPPPPVAMDEVDTSATGMLRLQDLDERFAETIFGREAEAAARRRD